MPRHSSLLFFVALLLAFAAPAVQAATDDGELARQRDQFPAVWEMAKRDPTESWARLAAGLESYPLYPYLGLASMQRRIAQLTREEADAFLKAWPDSLPAATLREAFLLELAKREDWKNYLALYDDTTHSRELRCDALQAHLALGEKLDFEKDVEPLWLSANALPAACDAAARWAQDQGKLTSALVWQRIELASAKAFNAGVIAALAPLLDGAEREAAEHTALALHDPAVALKHASGWPDAPRSRTAITLAIERLARHDADDADAQWSRLSTQFHFDAAQRGRALRAIALYRATSYSPDALSRLTALPADLADDTTREWRVRSALATGDFKATLAALEIMPEVQRNDARWRYLRARMLAKLGRGDEATALFRALASEANFYGFLAADQIGAAYTICATELVEDKTAEDALHKDPNLSRAFEFFAIDRLTEARREWDFAMQSLSAEQRRQAIALAERAGWIDRAVYAFNRGEDLRLYTLRFPLVRREQILRDARAGGVDPAWAYAIIRAESAWTTDAKSAANAYGLMQLLPGTAARLARERQLSYSGAADLLDPDLNIQLGTLYLGQMAARYDGSPWLASAAYNAGPDPVTRWVDARDSLDPDFFIETIPYKETREYVSRVLAFSVIYDWRLHGAVQTLSSRLPRIGQAYDPPGDKVMRRAVACPAAKEAAPSTAAVSQKRG
ncbi:MAG TPA: transglycosylase SLT domain-containing protein [Rudaea sp.]|uniref:transglycosylase SLT domain-containing protein n=1 Tax=Rudaea sp. TaxID=2136325 RepID=UPI002F937729